MCLAKHMCWGSKDTLHDSVLSFHHMESENRTQGIRFAGTRLHLLTNHPSNF